MAPAYALSVERKLNLQKETLWSKRKKILNLLWYAMNGGQEVNQQDFVLIKLLRFRSQQQLISLNVHQNNLQLMLR